MKEIHVVGAAIIQDGLVLTVQRSDKMTLPGLWEFPGGKIEAGESKEAALVREIEEELGAIIKPIDFINTASYDYEFGRVFLSVYTAEITSGQIELTEHSDLKWVEPGKLLSIDWAPVDIPAAKILAENL